MNRKKVAIIQNRLQRGGRLQVMVHMIRMLNELNIHPDILTLSSRISEKDIKLGYYSRKLSYKVIEIFLDMKMPFEWNILYFNYIINSHLKKYDLVINSNNTSFLLNDNINMISYIHFPRKQRNIVSKKSIHFPNGHNKSIWDIKSDFLKIASSLYKRDIKIGSKEILIANSIFTKKNIINCYNVKPQSIKVIYPPVEIKKEKIRKKQKNVVSLGRFSEDKRQLEQIKIAQRLPNFNFYILGFVNSKEYYNHCKYYLEKNKIKNVFLKPNLSKNDLSEILSESKYFIHSLRNEPFGITTVQAIINNMIPIVHNSGGQKEIVILDELRYNNIDHAVKIFKHMEVSDQEQLNNFNKILNENILKFGVDNFDIQFRSVLENKLNF